jgi:hypothetical protein
MWFEHTELDIQFVKPRPKLDVHVAFFGKSVRVGIEFDKLWGHDPTDKTRHYQEKWGPVVNSSNFRNPRRGTSIAYHREPYGLNPHRSRGAWSGTMVLLGKSRIDTGKSNVGYSMRLALLWLSVNVTYRRSIRERRFGDWTADNIP